MQIAGDLQESDTEASPDRLYFYDGLQYGGQLMAQTAEEWEAMEKHWLVQRVGDCACWHPV